MKGLCHKCYSSNVELELLNGQTLCQKCRNPPENNNLITIDKEKIL